MRNREIRQWYRQQVSAILQHNEQWRSQGLSAEQRARRAWEIRGRVRLEAREMMTDPAEVEMLRRRDLGKYGRPDGPSFEQLVEALRGRLSGDSLFEELIRQAARTDPGTDRLLAPPEQEP